MTAGRAVVPGWLDRSAAVGWRALAVALMAAVAGLVIAAIPVSATAILVSLVVAAALAPTAIRLRRAGATRAVAAAVAFGGGAVLIVGASIVLLLAVLPELRAVAAAVEQGIDVIRTQVDVLGAPEGVATMAEDAVASVWAALQPSPSDLAASLVDAGTVLVLGTFLTYFLLADGDRGWGWLTASLGPRQRRAVTVSAWRGLLRVAWYVRRTALLAAVDGVVVGVVTALLGLPVAGALAGIAFVAGFVPYLGAVVGGALIALATFALGGTGAAIAVVAALVVAWVVATRLLEGTTMNRSVDVHPVLVLVAIPAGAALLGLLGIVALLPITVFGLAIGRSVRTVLELGPVSAEPEPGPTPVTGSAALEPGSAIDPIATPGVPRWLDRLAQWCWRGLVLAGLLWLAIEVVVRISLVVVPAVIALVGAATLLPLVRRLGARGWSRGTASAVAIAGAASVIVALTLGAVLLTLGPLGDVLDAAVAGAGAFDLGWLRDAAASAATGIEVDLAAVFGDLLALALALLLAVLMMFFFLREGGGWWTALLGRLDAARRPPVAEAGSCAVEVLAGYMIGTAVISAFGGVTTGLILVVLGLPLALPIAVISFFAGFIPYLGSFLSTALALLVTVALGTPTDVVVMLVFTVVFNIAQGNFVTPLVYGRSLSLHPAVVLMAIPVGNEVAGVLGMFLVVPAAAMVAATWRLVLRAIDHPGDAPGAAGNMTDSVSFAP